MMNIVRKASTLAAIGRPTSQILTPLGGVGDVVSAKVDAIQKYPKFGLHDPEAFPYDIDEDEDHCSWDEPKKLPLPLPIHPQTNATLRKGLPTGALTVTSSLFSGTQVRHYHPSKYPVPNFDDYRKEWAKNPSPAASTADKKKTISYLANGVALTTTLVVTKHVVRCLVGCLAPAPEVLALGSIEVELKDIPEGKSAMFKWRGKPIFVRHRTADEIGREQSVAVSELRDPQTDADRASRPEWLVVIGVCTHLGCVPIANMGDFGGYYCPCHGSHYDGSGRIRKGPAPLNLEIPPHDFKDNGLLIIG